MLKLSSNRGNIFLKFPPLMYSPIIIKILQTSNCNNFDYDYYFFLTILLAGRQAFKSSSGVITVDAPNQAYQAY